MSSTTDRRGSRGQALVIFALALTSLVLVAALAFDMGMVMLERRDEQNAADAAALAGARFLPGEPSRAIAEARKIATANGYTDGANSSAVVVTSPYGGQKTLIEVRIRSTRQSIFAGILRRTGWNVGARAVAVNGPTIRGPFAMLTLHPTQCGALTVEGKGELYSNGNIQVNSNCPSGAFRVAGQGEVITAPHAECNVAGDYSQGGNASNNCSIQENEPVIPDPFQALPYPPIPTAGNPPVIIYPTPPVQVAGPTMSIPAGCPGSATPATDAAPRLCDFVSSYAGTTWRLFPGYYPGGLNFTRGTFYLEPGIYHLADGGFRQAGQDVHVLSVAPGGTTLGGGVLLFNTTHPTNIPKTGCAADGTCPIVLQGGSATSNLLPYVCEDADGEATCPWNNMVIFQNRSVTQSVSIVGSGANIQVRGLIYAPSAAVIVQGDSGTKAVDQIIASTFRLAGNGGTLRVEYNGDHLPQGTFAGLME